MDPGKLYIRHCSWLVNKNLRHYRRHLNQRILPGSLQYTHNCDNKFKSLCTSTTATGHNPSVDRSAKAQQFRPTYSTELFRRILHFIDSEPQKNTGHRNLAVDVGCGIGNSTSPLATYFKQVIGLDVSNAQLKEANAKNQYANVKYMYGHSSALPIGNSEVDLITAAQSVHWFDLKSFYKEVDRVLKPAGCLAFYGYDLPQLIKSDNTVCYEFDCLIQELYRKRFSLVNEWNLFLWGNLYKDVNLPYKDSIRDVNLSIRMVYTVDRFVGYLTSTAAFAKYYKEDPRKGMSLLTEVKERIMQILIADSCQPESEFVINFPMVLLLSRK